MKRVALVLAGLLLSTGVLAGKPPPATCPCNFDQLYDNSDPACFVFFNSGKSHGTEDNWLRWQAFDGSTWFGEVRQNSGERTCSGYGLVETFLSRKEYLACVEALKLVADDASTLPDCP